MNAAKIAAALRAQAEALKLLADALETEAAPVATAPVTTASPQPAAPATQKRGRGRPAAGEGTAAPAASAEPQAGSSQPASAPVAGPAQPEADPFAPAPVAPTVTQDQVRGALTALRTATDQATALKVLADAGGGATTLVGQGDTVLKPQFYDAVFKAAVNAAAATPAGADPFGSAPTAAQPAAAPTLTIDEVKTLTTKTVARTTADTVQRVLMQHGGKATNPDTGIEGPSLKALPEANYVAYVKALEALPSVK